MNPELSRFKPDDQAHTPLYLQLGAELERLITTGDSGTATPIALPSERTLAELTGVSRVTARKAIAHLVAQGLIEKRHGSGNYIKPRLEQPTSKLVSFSEELRHRGFTPSSRWLTRTLGAATPEQQQALQLAPSTMVARLERLRLADDLIMAYEYSVLPASIVAFPAAVTDSLYAYLKANGHAPVRAIQHIRATNAGDQRGALMGVSPHQSLIFVARTSFSEAGHPIELTHSYCHSDYYDFVAELRLTP